MKFSQNYVTISSSEYMLYVASYLQKSRNLPVDSEIGVSTDRLSKNRLVSYVVILRCRIDLRGTF